MNECTCKAVAIDGQVWHSMSCPANVKVREHAKLSRAGLKAVRMGVRDAGFEAEDNDCFVKAVQAITGVPYRDAHAFVAKRFNRKVGRGTFDVVTITMAIETGKELIYGFRLFIKPAAIGTGIRRSRFGYRQVTRYRTLEQFARTHRTGRWLLWSNDHAFAMVDGVVYDSGAAGARTQVTGVCEFIESSKVEGGN
jgi:hypothetical protein